MPEYTVRPARGGSPLESAWESDAWQAAPEARIDHFHAASSSHRPDARAKLLYDAKHLYVRFRVDDRYVVSTRTRYQESVCRDSCVEFFVQPRVPGGYFNFEVNCGGTLLLYYIEDETRTAEGFAKATPVAEEYGWCVRIVHSMPEVVTPEMAGPAVWHVGYAIPLAVLEAYVGPLGDLAGQSWRCNLYKCADESSHPHWASWAPIGQELNFHQPRYFAPLKFAPAAAPPPA